MRSQRFLNIQNFAGIFSQLSIYSFDLEERGALVSVSYPILWYLSYSGACLTASRKEMHKACRKPKNWKTAEQDEGKKMQICYTVLTTDPARTKLNRLHLGFQFKLSLKSIMHMSLPEEYHLSWLICLYPSLMSLLLGADQIFYISYTELMPTPFSFAIPYLVFI